MPGKKHEFGDVVLVDAQFIDRKESKVRPALVLYSEQGNTAVSAITSNPTRRGIPLTKKEGAVLDSIIKINYLFTIPDSFVIRQLFTVGYQKREMIKSAFLKRLHRKS